jgi:hypothetical protein
MFREGSVVREEQLVATAGRGPCLQAGSRLRRCRKGWGRLSPRASGTCGVRRTTAWWRAVGMEAVCRHSEAVPVRAAGGRP